MADYDSDSDVDGEQAFTTTNVLLGYASKESVDDTVSQLGGVPAWISGQAPSAKLARCLNCNELMSLLLQLHADLPEKFPGHERRLHVFGCRRKACRRKKGSVRALRSTRVDPSQAAASPLTKAELKTTDTPKQEPAKQSFLGTDLFGGSRPPSGAGNKNPFATSMSSSSQAAGSNPFSLSSVDELASKPPQQPAVDDLGATFTDKARISSSSSPTPASTAPTSPPEAWPTDTSALNVYPTYFLDADYEALGEESGPPPPQRQQTQVMELEDETAGSGPSGAKAVNDAFESSIDAAFQRFADRLSHNPEQVLRYEFGGKPLLYSKTDAVGRMLAPHLGQREQGAGGKVVEMVLPVGPSSRTGMPNCANCGATRVFECQLTPHAIAELEVEDEGVDGMEWGTVIVGVCSRDCEAKGVARGKVGYLEEWTGVQWEESKK